ELDSEQPPAETEGKEEPFKDERGLFRKRGRRIRKIDHILQIDEMDCGAACLGMICRYFGRKVSLARIRQLCHTATDGTSLKALSHAATELGLAARALKISLRNLPLMPLPAIVHWEGNHWMVLDRVIFENDVGLLKTILLGLIAAIVFVQLSTLAQEYLLAFATVRLDTVVLDFLSRKLLSLPMTYFTSRRTGDIQRRLDGAR